jgi:hypothetical protein
LKNERRESLRLLAEIQRYLPPAVNQSFQFCLFRPESATESDFTPVSVNCA